MRRPAPISQPPTATARSQDVIDLTEEVNISPERDVLPSEQLPDSPPRRLHHPQQRRLEHRVPTPFVIDLSDGENIPPRQASPDIQFISSRPRSRSLSLDNRARRPASHDRPRPLVQNERSMWLGRTLPQLQHLGNQLGRMRDHLVAWERVPVPETHFDMPLPDMMDFQQVGFNYDHPFQPQQPQPRAPTYDAPPPPQEGFTRSNTEEDLLMVCPECEGELGVGNSEERRQVWVVRNCGHVRVIQRLRDRCPR